MDLPDLIETANRISRDYIARWAKAVRNQHLFLFFHEKEGSAAFVPINYLAYTLEGRDPGDSRINPKAKSVREIEQVLQRSGFRKISASNSDFANFFYEYLYYYKSFGGTLPKDYTATRRRLALEGRTYYWISEK